MFAYTLQHVANRGVPPDSFLRELIAWAKGAADEIFAPRPAPLGRPDLDVYPLVKGELGPWTGVPHRRAVMCEILRVLAGLESSWRWNCGRDLHNPEEDSAETISAGAWQVSANSLNFGQDLKDLVRREVGSLNPLEFQSAMKSNHPLAMEYAARLLRHTHRHNGPVLRHEIDRWLSRDATAEFQIALIS